MHAKWPSVNAEGKFQQQPARAVHARMMPREWAPIVWLRAYLRVASGRPMSAHPMRRPDAWEERPSLHAKLPKM